MPALIEPVIVVASERGDEFMALTTRRSCVPAVIGTLMPVMMPERTSPIAIVVNEGVRVKVVPVTRVKMSLVAGAV